MGHLPTESMGLPFNGSTPLSRQTSAQGAVRASERVARKMLALLTLYREHGPLTDRQAATLLRTERSSINSLRDLLIKRGLVLREPVDRVPNEETGVPNCRWGLPEVTR